MSERTVEKGQVYLSNEDERRNGSRRTVTVERTVMAKRVYDTQEQLYAIAVSRIDFYPGREDLIGKKRRVFIKVKSLLSAQYDLLVPVDVSVTEFKSAGVIPHLSDVALFTTSPCGEPS